MAQDVESKVKTLCFLLLMLLAPAYAEDVKPSKLNINFLCQHWIHAREEEQGNGVQIYQPSTLKKFPPSRFRMQYIFAKEGMCKWMFLSPVDAHQLKDGKWKIDDRGLQIIKGEATESCKVMELTKDTLKLKPLPAAK